MVYIWIGALIAFIVVEAVTVQLVTVWFAAGALAALIALICGANQLVQLFIFIGVSAIALAVTRPLVKKLTKRKYAPTNADRCIGSQAKVTEEINNLKATGKVNVKGVVWTARSADDSIIRDGETVVIQNIEGVKLIVTLCNENSTATVG